MAAQAQAQDVSKVLDPSYNPTTPELISLFNEKQKYIYAIFECVLLTDHGKTFVCDYSATYDA